MKQKILVSIVILFFYYNFAMAQEWSKEDSIRLKNILDGKEAFKINEDIRIVIGESHLTTPFLMNKRENPYLDLIKDFDNIVSPDSMRNLDPYSMPPAVFSLYTQKVLKATSPDYTKHNFKLTDKDIAEIKKASYMGRSNTRLVNTDPLQKYRGINFVPIMSLMFKMIPIQLPNRDDKNKEPAPMTENERKLLNQSINNLRQSIESSVEQD